MFIDHFFAKSAELPPIPPGILYQYVIAANGVFVRAERPGLSVMIWSSALTEPIRGLASVEPYVRMAYPTIPECGMYEIIKRCIQASPQEILFWLSPPQQPGSPWGMVVPRQVRSSGSVRPVDPHSPLQQGALIELHSHHEMSAFFSRTDDADETGFRIYAVVGKVSTHPHITVRVGVYGHFWEIPASWVFDLPHYVQDEVAIEVEVITAALDGQSMEVWHDNNYDPA